MNCPCCKELIGADQASALSEWTPVLDANGVAQALERSQYVACDHCGLFEVTEDDGGRRYHRWLHSPKDIRRAEQAIPACQFDRRIPA